MPLLQKRQYGNTDALQKQAAAIQLATNSNQYFGGIGLIFFRHGAVGPCYACPYKNLPFFGS
jgi:hypothetical protein